MPALVGRTSTVGLTQATEPFVVQFVELGVKGALSANAGLAKGLNTEGGRITCPALEALGTPDGAAPMRTMRAIAKLRAGAAPASRR